MDYIFLTTIDGGAIIVRVSNIHGVRVAVPDGVTELLLEDASELRVTEKISEVWIKLKEAARCR